MHHLRGRGRCDDRRAWRARSSASARASSARPSIRTARPQPIATWAPWASSQASAIVEGPPCAIRSRRAIKTAANGQPGHGPQRADGEGAQVGLRSRSLAPLQSAAIADRRSGIGGELRARRSRPPGARGRRQKPAAPRRQGRSGPPPSPSARGRSHPARASGSPPSPRRRRPAGKTPPTSGGASARRASPAAASSGRNGAASSPRAEATIAPATNGEATSKVSAAAARPKTKVRVRPSWATCRISSIRVPPSIQATTSRRARRVVEVRAEKGEGRRAGDGARDQQRRPPEEQDPPSQGTGAASGGRGPA